MKAWRKEPKIPRPIIGHGKRNGNIMKKMPVAVCSPKILPKSRNASDRIRARCEMISIGIIRGANSGSGLQSMPAAYLLADEVSSYPFEADDKGDPLENAEARTSTFPMGKVLITSTPGTRGMCRITHEFEQRSDRRQLAMLMPCCGALEVLRTTGTRQRTVVNRHQTDAVTVFVKRQCLHCWQPACASACLTNAMYKTHEGPVIWRESKCMGCRYCMVACPFEIPRFEYDSPVPRIEIEAMPEVDLPTGSALVRTQCTTIRLKLLKVAARKVWLSFSESYPYAKDFAQILANLQRQPIWNASGQPTPHP